MEMAGCQCLSFHPHEWVKGKAIGSGSFAVVHLAMNKAKGSLFVVKSAESRAGIQSLMNEVNILEGLDSPFVVKCMGRESLNESSNGESKMSIFMEYMAGGSLSEVAEKFGGALPEEVIRLYTREILYGLKYLHENGTVHCDLKCKNVLLGSSGDVKLADFGCARRLNDMKGSEDLAVSWKFFGGTPLWMAPEVLKNENLDYASDIWSLGCTVIEMATGKLPWGAELSNPMAAVLKIACSNEMPPFPAQFSEEGLDFLRKCLQRDPERRWTAEDLLRHPFITGRNPWKECVCSPASILDRKLHEQDCDSDEDDGFPLRNPFSTTNSGERKRKVGRQQAECDMEGLEDWITVRSN